MNIGVDMDDVLAEFQRWWLLYHNKNYGTNLSTEDVFGYNLSKVMQVEAEVIFNRIHEFYDSDDFELITPVLGAKEILDTLKENKIYVITSRDRRIQEKTISWLDKYFPNIFTEIILTNQFGKIKDKNTKKKSDICKLLEIDIMIEDSLEYSYDIAECGTKVLLLDKPWNREVIKNKNINRVESWNFVGDYINSAYLPV